LTPEHESTGEKTEREGQPRTEAPLRPNMLLVQAEATSSTFSRLKLDHCVFDGCKLVNSMFHQSNFESSTFSGAELDGTLFDNCSLRGVVLRNCEVDGLVINGVEVGRLLKVFAAGGWRE
jgi:uncharacterized protein YjbI with pentapeptide repeats